MKAIAYALWKEKLRLQNNAARTILLWNRRVRMRWWFDDQTRHQQNGPVVTSTNDEQLYNDGGMYANDGGLDNCGLYDCGDGGPYKAERVYDNKWSILPLEPSNKQQCKKIATVARACVDNTTINNGTSAAHRRSKAHQRTGQRHQPWAPDSQEVKPRNHNDLRKLYDDNNEGSDDEGYLYNYDEGLYNNELYDDVLYWDGAQYNVYDEDSSSDKGVYYVHSDGKNGLPYGESHDNKGLVVTGYDGGTIIG